MNASWILAVVSAIFLLFAVVRIAQGQSPSHPKIRTWLIVAAILGAVSTWLWLRTP